MPNLETPTPDERGELVIGACACGDHIDTCGSCRTALDANNNLLRAERERVAALTAKMAEMRGVIYRNCDPHDATEADAAVIRQVCIEEWDRQALKEKR